MANIVLDDCLNKWQLGTHFTSTSFSFLFYQYCEIHTSTNLIGLGFKFTQCVVTLSLHVPREGGVYILFATFLLP